MNPNSREVTAIQINFHLTGAETPKTRRTLLPNVAPTTWLRVSGFQLFVVSHPSSRKSSTITNIMWTGFRRMQRCGTFKEASKTPLEALCFPYYRQVFWL